MYISIIKN